MPSRSASLGTDARAASMTSRPSVSNGCIRSGLVTQPAIRVSASRSTTPSSFRAGWSSSGMPKVQPQGPQEPGADGHKLAEVQLMNAARVIRSEELTATENDYCDYCSFHSMCPVKGSGTVLS